MIEEVKKLQDDICLNCQQHLGVLCTYPTTPACEFCKEICQLFEPKPDEGRLLTPLEIGNTLDCEKEATYPTSLGTVSTISVDALVRKQDAKAASIKNAECKERVERIAKQLRDYQKTGSVWSAELERITRQCEQALRKQEGIGEEGRNRS